MRNSTTVCATAKPFTPMHLPRDVESCSNDTQKKTGKKHRI